MTGSLLLLAGEVTNSDRAKSSERKQWFHKKAQTQDEGVLESGSVPSLFIDTDRSAMLSGG